MSNYRNSLDKLVDNVGYTIVRLAPIVAPIPALATLLEATGYAVYAWFVVVAVELTGYAIGEEAVKAIRLRIFSIRNIAWALGIYAFIIEGLMIGYKVLPAWVEWHTGAGEPVRELRMLPSAKPFGELRLEARRQGYELAVKGDSYYLVDKQGQFQRITGLIEQIERGDV